MLNVQAKPFISNDHDAPQDFRISAGTDNDEIIKIQIFFIPFSLATFDLDEIKMAISEKPNESSVPITVILDNVRTPDNIGALTRVAAAIGCKKIISTKVCLYNCT